MMFVTAAHSAAAPAADRWRSSYPLRLGSHMLTVAGRTGAVRLLLDGKPLAQAVRFELDDRQDIEGVALAAIYANRDGASCYDGSELVFAAPAGKPVVHDSVNGTSCQARPKVSEANGELVVIDQPVEAKPADATPAVAGSPGAVWLFDARHGLWRAGAIGPEGPDLE